MRNLLRSLLLVVCLVGLGIPTRAGDSARPTPVLVELFTSEGCSSCPPADALLIKLEQQPIAGAEVIALGHHVDYWDGIGWKDRFSSHKSTLRQQQYASSLRLEGPYTPEIVVDGHLDVVGNDFAGVRKAITSAAQDAKPATVNIKSIGAGVQVDVEGSPRQAEVFLAITESSLSTSVAGGENRGRQLQHTAVVRSLQSLGTTRDGRLAASVPAKLQREWIRDHLRAVVFVQEAGGRIVGAAGIPLNQ